MSDALAAEALRVWKADPIRMAKDLFDFTPDRWQAEALSLFPDPTVQRIAMQACANPGKTAVEAIMGWNFLLCYSDGVNHPNGAAVAITADNLKNNLWKEMAVWRGRSPVLQHAFEQTSETIFSREHPKTWFLSARSFSKTADKDAQGRTLSGLHAKAILYLLDETGDMPPAVLRSAEQGLGNCEWGKIIQAGNATSHEGALYQAAGPQAHLWHVIPITGDPDDPNRSTRVNIDWAREQIALWGRDNPWVMAFILGKFPPSSINALLGPDEVRAAMDRHLTSDQYDFAQKRLGIDVARFGDDSTVIFPRQGLAAFKPVEMRNARTDAIAARVMVAKERWGSELELIDSTGGWAAGVVDFALQAGVNILEINFSGKSDDPRYFNKRSEMHFRAAEWVKRGALPKVARLVREATAPTYWFENGKLRVEEKDQIKARIGTSPDFWDAFVLTFALVEMPASIEALTGLPMDRAPAHATTEFDPYADRP